MLYYIVFWQCTEAAKNQLEDDRSFQGTKKQSDAIKSLKLVKIIFYRYESKSLLFLEVHKSTKELYSSYHKNTIYCESYCTVKTIETFQPNT